MKVNSFYTYPTSDGLRLLRLIGQYTNPRSNRTEYRIWTFVAYNGPEEPTKMNWNYVLANGKKYKHTGTTTLYQRPTGAMLATIRRTPFDTVPYWDWTFEQFKKKVRASVSDQARYSDPKYFSQRLSRRKVYHLFVNRQTLQLQQDSTGAEMFRSTDDNYLAKRGAYDYIISRATDLGMIPKPSHALSLRARAVLLNLKLLTL